MQNVEKSHEDDGKKEGDASLVHRQSVSKIL